MMFPVEGKLKIIKSLRYLKIKGVQEPLKSIISPLIYTLDDENPSVRFQALAALQKFTKQKIGSKSELWKKWYEKQSNDTLSEQK